MTSGMEVVELDTIPSPGDEGVQSVLRDLDDHLHMKSTISMIESVGKYMYVSTNAAARDAKQLVKVQDCLFNIIKLNDACSLMMQSFQSGANNILEKLKVAYLYLLDGFPDFAMTDIEAISKDVGSMKSAVDKHLKAEKKTEEKITHTHDVVKKALSEFRVKVQDLERQVAEKKVEIKRLEAADNGSPRNGAFGDDPGTGGDPPPKTRISKLYVLVLLLVVVKYCYYCEVGEKISPLMRKFASESEMLAHSLIGMVVLLVLLFKWIIDSQCRNRTNVALACAVCCILFVPISLQKDGRLQLRHVPDIFPSLGGINFAEAYSGEQVGQRRGDKLYQEAWDKPQENSEELRPGGASTPENRGTSGSEDASSPDEDGSSSTGSDETPFQHNEDGEGRQKKPSQVSDAGETKNAWFGSDGSKSHNTQAELATKIEGSGFETVRPSSESDTVAETNGNISLPSWFGGMTSAELILNGTCSIWEIFYYIPPVSGVAFKQQSECQTRKHDVDSNDTVSIKCYPPDQWYLLLLSPVILIVFLVGLTDRKDLHDSFSGPIVLIFHLGVSVCICLPLTNQIHNINILDYLEPFKVANIGVLSSGILAVVIPVCILICKSKSNDGPGTRSLVPIVRPSREEELSDAKEKLRDLEMSLKTAKGQLESTQLTDLLFDKSFPYLLGIEDILSKSITLVETWYKECKDVVEPNMGKNIDRAAGIDQKERQRYWNSLQFKQEVVGYYCRWRALQVYCEENRKFIRAARQKIENWYTENLHPREAVAKSLKQAAELDDPDVQVFLREHGQVGASLGPIAKLRKL